MRRCRRSISRQTNSTASGTILLLQTNNQPEAVIYRQALRLILVLSDKKQRPFWTLCRLYKMQHGLVACAVRWEKIIGGGEQEAVKLRDSVAVTLGSARAVHLRRQATMGRRPSAAQKRKSSFTVAMKSWREAPGAIDRSTASMGRAQSRA